SPAQIRPTQSRPTERGGDVRAAAGWRDRGAGLGAAEDGKGQGRRRPSQAARGDGEEPGDRGTGRCAAGGERKGTACGSFATVPFGCGSAVWTSSGRPRKNRRCPGV